MKRPLLPASAGRTPTRRHGQPAGIDRVVDLAERLERLDATLDRELRRRSGRTPPAPPGTVGQALARVREAATESALTADEVLEPGLESVADLFLDLLYGRWWRARVDGIDNVPSTSAALLVAGHSGSEYEHDGALLRVVMRREHPAPRELHAAGEIRWFRSFGERRRWLPELLSRLGQGDLVAVFPEGSSGVAKRLSARRPLARFRGVRFAVAAIDTGAPIIPTAIVRPRGTSPSLVSRVASPVAERGLRRFAAWNPLLGFLPSPGLWRVAFGDPIDPQSIADAAFLTREVRARLAQLVADALAS